MKKEWFTQIPNMTIKGMKRLNYKQLALYVYYKCYAGEDGYCNRTIRNISSDLQMSPSLIIEVRDELEMLGFIEVLHLSPRRFKIFIKDLWEQNRNASEEYKVVSKQKHNVSK